MLQSLSHASLLKMSTTNFGELQCYIPKTRYSNIFRHIQQTPTKNVVARPLLANMQTQQYISPHLVARPLLANMRMGQGESYLTFSLSGQENAQLPVVKANILNAKHDHCSQNFICENCKHSNVGGKYLLWITIMRFCFHG